MYIFTLILHTTGCIMLVAIIMMQSGRGGGLTENFSSAESMFGAKTNVVLIKATTILASLFLVTSLSLAFMSSQKNKSLMSGEVLDVEEETKGVGIAIEEPQKVADKMQEGAALGSSISQEIVVSEKPTVEPNETADNANQQNTTVPQTEKPTQPENSQ